MNQNLSMTAGPNLEDELNIDKNTLETLKDLYAQKEQAVLREDFDEAKRLKISIENFKNMSTQLGALEERKKIAILHEDYDAAKIIKNEIEKLKYSAIASYSTAQ